MKAMTRKRWVIVGLVLAAVIAIFLATHKPTPLFAVRVLPSASDQTNAVIEIANNTGAPVWCAWPDAAMGNVRLDSLKPGDAYRIPIPLDTPEFTVAGMRPTGPLIEKFVYKPARHLGIDLYGRYEFDVFRLTRTRGSLEVEHLDHFRRCPTNVPPHLITLPHGPR